MSNIVENINEITVSSLKTGEIIEGTFSGVIDLFSKVHWGTAFELGLD